MTNPAPTFRVHVDARNPGQFFACCGLLELAHRLWPGTEGWFDLQSDGFLVFAGQAEASLRDLAGSLVRCEISSLTEEERNERNQLEREKRELKKRTPPATLPQGRENRRKELGQKARAGALRLAGPFALLLDWWQASNGEQTPKTWAGLQEIHRVARSAQDALSGIGDLTTILDHGCIMRTPEEYSATKAGRQKAVEPFYFDARRFSHSLDAGFSLDVMEAETVAHPAVELLSLIGLQRFRPIVERAREAKVKAFCEYWVWRDPVCAAVAASLACGSAPTRAPQHYRFPLWARDDEKRYGAFGWATMIGDGT